MTDTPSPHMLTELRRPFSREALRWKPQILFGAKDSAPSGGIFIAYIDRALVIDRLNTVAGFDWRDDYERVDDKFMICRLTVHGTTRQDVGRLALDLRGLYSDALKRAAVKFGVGVSLARVPQSKIVVTDGDVSHATAWHRGGDRRGLDLTQRGLDHLRDRYQQWLDQVGVDTFGEPLASGDLGEAQGDEDEGPVTRPGLDAGDGDGSAAGIALPPDVEQIIVRAGAAGVAGYDRGAVELIVGGRDSRFVAGWVTGAAADIAAHEALA